MEDALRGEEYFKFQANVGVLILIVMEDALRARGFNGNLTTTSLNPYCNGRCS